MAKDGFLPKLKTSFRVFTRGRKKTDSSVGQKRHAWELVQAIESPFRPTAEITDIGVGRQAVLVDDDADRFSAKEVDKVLSLQQRRIEELNQVVQLKTSETEAIQRLVEAAADVIDGFQKLLSDRDRKILELEILNRTLMEQVQQKDTTLTQQDIQVKSLKTENNDLSSKLLLIQNVNDTYEVIRNSEAEKSRELEAVRELLSSVKRANSENQMILELLNISVAEKDKEIESYKKTISDFTDRLRTERETLIQRDRRIDTLEERNKVLESTTSERIAEIATLSRLLLEKEKLLAARTGGTRLVTEAGERGGGTVPTLSQKSEVAPQKGIIVKSPVFRSEERQRERRLIEQSGLFDESWYRSQNPDMALSGLDALDHYLEVGGKQGRDPSPRFSTKRYYELNRDAPLKGGNPLLVYLEYGASAKRAADPRDG